MVEPQASTATFLFTDLVRSTRLWEEQPDQMRAALTLHDELVHGAIEAHGGRVVKSTGDGAFGVFSRADDGIEAAVAAQRALAAAAWPTDVALSVRMGLHAGPVTERSDGDYFGADVNRTARLTGVAHGGQIVCSRPIADLVRGTTTLLDLGEHQLRDLQSTMQVFQVIVADLPSAFPPLQSLDALRGNLPRQATSFVGRREELESLTTLVRDNQLVTLTGVGGVGKTRLALQAAAELLPELPGGAWLCEYAPVTDPDATWDALAATLSVPAVPGRPLEESVLDYLAPKRVLLVLDNCEHLLDPIARQVDAILRRCSSVSVLATSREGLGLGGERMVAVPSLRLAADDASLDDVMGADAVHLFVDRAIASKSDFVLTERNAHAVGVLCRRLDGIPLAIELAAARVPSLSPDDLVAHLDQRFKLLTRGSRAAMERHQTLRNTIDWSYDLLEVRERDALNRLSVFSGGCDLPAAEAVLAGDDLDALDVIDAIGQLVGKSLVTTDAADDGSVRYRLLESIRQYAQERLEASGETAAVRRRHADHFVAVAEAAGPHLRRREQVEWSRATLREADNFRAALDWAIEAPSHEHALRMVAPLAVTGMPIGDLAEDWADTACDVTGAEDHPLFATVAGFASLGATLGRDFERAEERAAAAEAAAERSGAPNPSVLRARAALAFFTGDLERATSAAESWVSLGRASGDPDELAHALLMLSATQMGDASVASVVVAEAVDIARAFGILSVLSTALPLLASLVETDRPSEALALLDEGIEAATRIGDRVGVSLVTGTKGTFAIRVGDWPAGLAAAVAFAERQLERGDLSTLPGGFLMGGECLVRLGHHEPGAVIHAKALSMVDRATLHQEAVERMDQVDELLLAGLGASRVAQLSERGAGLTYADAVAYLRAEADRALARSDEQSDAAPEPSS